MVGSKFSNSFACGLFFFLLDADISSFADTTHTTNKNMANVDVVWRLKWFPFEPQKRQSRKKDKCVIIRLNMWDNAREKIENKLSLKSFVKPVCQKAGQNWILFKEGYRWILLSDFLICKLNIHIDQIHETHCVLFQETIVFIFTMLRSHCLYVSQLPNNPSCKSDSWKCNAFIS